MDHEFKEYHHTFIAGETGRVVLQLAEEGAVISRDSIIERLEEKRSNAVNVIHKGLLRDAVELLLKGGQGSVVR